MNPSRQAARADLLARARAYINQKYQEPRHARRRMARRLARRAWLNRKGAP
jgi:hypothetical protein